MTATTAPVSKKAIAAALYTTMSAAGDRRKDIIAKMIADAGLTKPGAATYYNNFRTGVWKIAAPTAVAGAVAPVEVVVMEETPAAPAETATTEDVVAESTAPVAEVVLPDNYAEMSKAELVALYNSKSEKPVKDFRNHETAVRRVTELFAPVAA